VKMIFGLESSYHPLSEENLHMARSGDRVTTEARVLSKRKRGLLTGLHTLSVKLQVRFVQFLIRHNIAFNSRGKNLRDVRRDNILSSDFRKLDGTLKMVISGTTENRRKLEALLRHLHARGHIFYGVHVSNRALLTCLLQYGSGSEVHFVDAADGGYALAARHMKQQLAEAVRARGARGTGAGGAR